MLLMYGQDEKAISFQFDMQLSFCFVGLARGSFCAVTVFFSRQQLQQPFQVIIIIMIIIIIIIIIYLTNLRFGAVSLPQTQNCQERRHVQNCHRLIFT